MTQFKMHLLVCGGTGCRASESELLFHNLKKEILEKGLEDEVQVITTGCFGFCEKGPIVKVMPDNTFYTQVKPEDAIEIIAEHVIKGRQVNRLLYMNPETEKHVSDSKHMGFYRKQLKNAGIKVSPGVNIEISPLCDMSTLTQKIQSKEIVEETYIE